MMYSGPGSVSSLMFLRLFFFFTDKPKKFQQTCKTDKDTFNLKVKIYIYVYTFCINLFCSFDKQTKSG